MTKAEEFYKEAFFPSMKTMAYAGTLGAAGLVGHSDKQEGWDAKATAIKGGTIGAIGGAVRGAFKGKGFKGIVGNIIGGAAVGAAAGGVGRALTKPGGVVA